MAEYETADFKTLVGAKIALRRRGFKDGVRYATLESVMKRRFGRT